MKIAAFHLLNDFSGSPRVLAMVLRRLLESGHEVDLVTTSGGVLDNMVHPRLRFHNLYYRFSRNKAAVALRYASAQISMFFKALRLCRGRVCYINTLLPVGAALGARLAGAKVVYHYHEHAYGKGGVYVLLARCMERLATKIVCVSEHQASFLKNRSRVHVVRNGVADDLASRLVYDPERAFAARTVLMLASLREYKGIDKFARLAASLPCINFMLVVNDSYRNAEAFMKRFGIRLPANLRLVDHRQDVTPYYNSASVIMNLSGGKVRETFGLTVAEASFAGLPAIVPPEGGIAELVEDGVNGWHVDPEDADILQQKVSGMLDDRALYFSLSGAAKKKSAACTESRMTAEILNIIESM